ncbi:hypothetical protein BB560_000818 [Smittium megazygosporum]|uniref:FCP1 homology domain-containing protein n=1 Tax=Smittium megazygosporum TaxID=133381 RepID=A0A2T9ZJD7_9FUNG|nr:hypothetical protein BB560_000818 [Smittium megazygosporum]
MTTQTKPHSKSRLKRLVKTLFCCIPSKESVEETEFKYVPPTLPEKNISSVDTPGPETPEKMPMDVSLDLSVQDKPPQTRSTLDSKNVDSSTDSPTSETTVPNNNSESSEKSSLPSRASSADDIPTIAIAVTGPDSEPIPLPTLQASTDHPDTADTPQSPQSTDDTEIKESEDPDSPSAEDPPRISIDIGPSFTRSSSELLATALLPEETAPDHRLNDIIYSLSNPEEENFAEDDLELRSEIASPRNNIASTSSEKLVTRISHDYLLGPLLPEHYGRKCLVLDLDETLVHSSFKPIPSPDFIVPVILNGQQHDVYVSKRPYVDHFLLEASKYYELVVFTASLALYADPVVDLLDTNNVISFRLFRESCSLYNMNYVKDLARLGRPTSDIIIVDNSPASYLFQPENAIAISSWFNDPHDSELIDLLPFLVRLSEVQDVTSVLNINRESDIILSEEGQPLAMR